MDLMMIKIDYNATACSFLP